MAKHVEMLMEVLDYIENNIAGDITVEDVANHSYVSISSLQKTFKYVFHMSVKEYLLRRRFTCAAKEILSTNKSILEIALKYGYSSHESFTRGFKKVWGVTPNEYRKHRHFYGHTPKLSIRTFNEMEDVNMSGTKFNLTELYDVLRERKGKAYVCADLEHLMWINNELGRDAGDAALLEMMHRIEEACTDNDIFLRVGGDEFVVFTDSEEMTHANEIVQKVSNQNGRAIMLGEIEIPIKIHIGSFLGFPENAKNPKEMFEVIAEKIDIVKQFKEKGTAESE